MKKLYIFLLIGLIPFLSQTSLAQNTNDKGNSNGKGNPNGNGNPGNGDSNGRVNWFPNRGNVGIGTRTPSEALEVIGNVRVSQTLFTNSLETVGLKATNLTVSQDATIGRNLLVQGNVGIGVAAPSEKLEISGNLKVSGAISGDRITIRQLTATDGLFSN